MSILRRKPHIELVTRRINPFFRIVAANGQTLTTSETYSSLGKARHTATSLSIATGWRVQDVKS